jgi:predicted O-methyltransferase YrrM
LTGLNGLITEDIGRELYALARHVPSGQNIVELGSYRGASTCWLAAGIRDEGVEVGVHAVDAWSTEVNAWSRYITSASLDEFVAQVTGFGLFKHVLPWQGLTTEVAERYAAEGQRHVGLLYIDADHSREAALADFHAWRNLLARGATVVFDDYKTRQNPGVEEAVSHLETTGYLELVELRAGRLAVASATDKAVLG